MNDFKKTLNLFGINENIQSFTSCTVCQLMVNEIITRPLTAEATGSAICSFYFLMQTWKRSTFCDDIIHLHLVSSNREFLLVKWLQNVHAKKYSDLTERPEIILKNCG